MKSLALTSGKSMVGRFWP